MTAFCNCGKCGVCRDYETHPRTVELRAEIAALKAALAKAEEREHIHNALMAEGSQKIDEGRAERDAALAALAEQKVHREAEAAQALAKAEGEKKFMGDVRHDLEQRMEAITLNPDDARERLASILDNGCEFCGAILVNRVNPDKSGGIVCLMCFNKRDQRLRERLADAVEAMSERDVEIKQLKTLLGKMTKAAEDLMEWVIWPNALDAIGRCKSERDYAPVQKVKDVAREVIAAARENNDDGEQG